MGWSRIRFKECLQHTIKNLDQKSSQWIHIYVTEQFKCLHRFKWWRRGRIYVSRICIGVTYSDSVCAIENEWWLCIHEVLFRLLFIFYLTYGKKVFSHPYKILSHYLHIHFYLSREEEGKTGIHNYLFVLNMSLTYSLWRSEVMDIESMFWMNHVLTARSCSQEPVNTCYGSNPRTSCWTLVMMEAVKLKL